MNARYATCARCGRPDRQVAKIMPDGPLCAACRAEAIRHRGHCDGCSQQRLLPGVYVFYDNATTRGSLEVNR